MDDLSDFEKTEFTHDGKTRAVYRKRPPGDATAPAVIVISEVPGITPLVADFARRCVDRGMTAVMPHLFGTPGKEPTNLYAAGVLAWSCISREFATLAKRSTSPATDWVRALARAEKRRCGGPGVGAVGMCLTGGFALAMMVDDEVIAPVLSQPSLPFPVGAERKRDLGISDEDLARVKTRVAQGVPVLGLKFTNDPVCPAERFQRLRDELGDGFTGIEIDSSKGNPHGFSQRAHSVLTEDLVDEPGNPTHEALHRTLDFFSERLGLT